MKLFLIGFEDSSTGENSVPGTFTLVSQKSMAGKTIYSRVEPATVSLLNAYSVKLPPKYLCIDNRPGLLSTLVQEASFCSGHQSI